MADFDELSDALDQSEGLIGQSDPAPTAYSLGAPFETVSGSSLAARAKRVAQRVWDASAHLWCYFVDDAPNVAPEPSKTKPPHSGNLGTHEVLWEAQPDLEKYALLSDLDSLQQTNQYVTQQQLGAAVSSAIGSALTSALEGQDIGDLAALLASKASAADLAAKQPRIVSLIADSYAPRTDTLNSDTFAYVDANNTVILGTTAPAGTIVVLFNRTSRAGCVVQYTDLQGINAARTLHGFGPRIYMRDSIAGRWHLIADVQPARFHQWIMHVVGAQYTAQRGGEHILCRNGAVIDVSNNPTPTEAALRDGMTIRVQKAEDVGTVPVNFTRPDGTQRTITLSVFDELVELVYHYSGTGEFNGWRVVSHLVPS